MFQFCSWAICLPLKAWAAVRGFEPEPWPVLLLDTCRANNGWLVEDVRETKWNQVWDQVKPVFCLLQINRKPRVFDYLTPCHGKWLRVILFKNHGEVDTAMLNYQRIRHPIWKKKHKWYHHCIFIVYHYIMIKHDIAMQTEQFFDQTNILGTVADTNCAKYLENRSAPRQWGGNPFWAPGMAITPPLNPTQQENGTFYNLG